jgi:hypothetical protein
LTLLVVLYKFVKKDETSKEMHLVISGGEGGGGAGTGGPRGWSNEGGPDGALGEGRPGGGRPGGDGPGWGWVKRRKKG